MPTAPQQQNRTVYVCPSCHRPIEPPHVLVRCSCGAVCCTVCGLVKPDKTVECGRCQMTNPENLELEC